MKPVLCFGDICPDLLIPYGAALSLADGVQLPQEALTVQVRPGGSLGNSCVGIRRQGVPTLFLGTVGDDGYGRMLRDDLIREGVDVSLLRVDRDINTVLVLIILASDGERVTFACPRTNASQHQITFEQIPDGLTERIAWMHSSGMTLREEPAASVQLSLMRRCQEAGVPVSLDVNARLESLGDDIFERNIREALRCCDVVFASAEDELAPLSPTGNAEDAAKQLLREGRKLVIARHGAGGATLYSPSGVIKQPIFPVRVCDTVGAGDAYDAGFIAALQKGETPQNANRLACATAAYCVARTGGRSTPTAQELRDFLAAYPAN